MSDPKEASLVSEGVKELLRKYLEEKNITVANIDFGPGSVHGDNYFGIIAKAIVTGTDANNKPIISSYIIKSAPKTKGIRANYPVRFVYEREIYIYTKMLPAMKQFQEEKRVKNPFDSYAICLKTSYENRDEAIIMEDMKAHGYTLRNRKNPLDYNHAKLVLTELGRLHAVSFAMLDQKPELFEEISKATKETFVTKLDLNSFQSQMERMCDKAQTVLNPETDQEIIEKFNKYRVNCVEDMKDMMTTNYYPYCVVRHGDAWTNNFLFAYRDEANPDKPTDLCILDWQQAHVCTPVLDLLCMFAAITDKQLRDKHYDELLKYYHDTMRQCVAEMGSDIDKLYPYEVFMQHMQQCGRFGLMSALMVMLLITSESEEIPDIKELFEAENVTKSLGALAFTSKNNEVYKTRMRDVFYFMAERNYI